MKFCSSILIETVIGVSFLPGDYYYLTLNEVIRCHPRSRLLTKLEFKKLVAQVI